MEIEVFDSHSSIGRAYDLLFANAELSSPYNSKAWYGNIVSTVFNDNGVSKFIGFLKNGEPIAMFPVYLRKTKFGIHLDSLSNYYTPLYAPLLKSDVLVKDVGIMLEMIMSSFPKLSSMRFSPMDLSSSNSQKLWLALQRAKWIPFGFFCFGNWYLPVDCDWDKYLSGRSGILRSTILRSMKKFVKDGGQIDIVTDSQQIQPFLEAYLDVYGRSWKSDEPHPSFIPGLVSLAAVKGWLRLGIATINSRPIAAQIWLVSGAKADIYKLAYDKRDKAYSPGTLLTAALMNYTFEHDCVSEVDYLTGDDAYKKQWMSHRRERWGIVAYSPRTLMGAFGLMREVLGRVAKRLFSGFAHKPWAKHVD